MSRRWPPDSSKSPSGKPGAVQCRVRSSGSMTRSSARSRHPRFSWEPECSRRRRPARSYSFSPCRRGSGRLEGLYLSESLPLPTAGAPANESLSPPAAGAPALVYANFVTSLDGRIAVTDAGGASCLPEGADQPARLAVVPGAAGACRLSRDPRRLPAGARIGDPRKRVAGGPRRRVAKTSRGGGPIGAWRRSPRSPSPEREPRSACPGFAGGAPAAGPRPDDRGGSSRPDRGARRGRIRGRGDRTRAVGAQPGRRGSPRRARLPAALSPDGSPDAGNRAPRRACSRGCT